MFQGMTHGALLHILYKNVPEVKTAKVVSVNTHLPQYNPAQPQAMLNGMVTDVTVTIGNETIPFAGLPANASSANFADKAMFIGEDMSTVLNEITALRENHQRVVDGYEPSKDMVAKCDALILSLNPDKRKEAQNAKEMAELKDELAEMKRMLSAFLGTKKKEE